MLQDLLVDYLRRSASATTIGANFTNHRLRVAWSTHAALGHDFFQIAVRDDIADVEERGEKDLVFRIMHAVEINRHVRVNF
ncbi:hypothetical protein P775_13375 [Puniceibacterium antarcticum]|uniref:Uncharacterized protein n=1 Tax=Puniceibacterium antarcticum TaxID=1206336 RepID=A0A2G8RDS2_9RHOB|nr:hypothetical protein P775_13375 [Puniceibacterium antarcticum]